MEDSMALDSDDADRLRRFEDGSMGNDDFGHVDHVRVAWACLVRDGLDEARRRFPLTLLRFATSKGHPEIFDAALTDDWLVVIEAARRAHPEAATFSELLARRPDLGDKSTVRKRS
jgi:hypothetical protein